MAVQALTAQGKRQCALFNALAIAGALGFLTVAAVAWADPSAAGWQVLRLAGLLSAGAIPVRLAIEAAAYCADDAGRPERRAVRVANRIGEVLDAPTASAHSFGQAILPGREALPSGSVHT